MSTMPQPRTVPQILGDQIEAFLARYGLPALKAGGPVLSILEAAAQSDFRASQDVFDLLKSVALDYAEGQALDRIGAEEKIARIIESRAYGTVTITDTTFDKIATTVYQGLPGPLAGSTSIYVLNASSFPGSGAIYLGRGTNNYEGPISYSAIFDLGSCYRIVLSLPTLRYHNAGETVVLAQGGKRTIAAGTSMTTQQTAFSSPVTFSTVYSAEIADGETEVADVQVSASVAGITGNIIAGALNSFISGPFTGAQVTNPTAFTTARATEGDQEYRERIRQARQSRSRGTVTALKFFANGVFSSSENRRVSSVAVVSPKDEPATLYIDDGTGYEGIDEGIAIESLMDYALGGERDFQLSERPVAKAYLVTPQAAPYTFDFNQGVPTLAVSVGGVTTEHSFAASDFRSPSNASAYEVVASINANADIDWSARTAEGGTKVVIYGKADQNEDIEVVAPSGTLVDANQWLEFALGKAETLRLYKNDRLLFKDGKSAYVISQPFPVWNSFVGPVTLSIAVDGTPTQSISITDADFAASGTGYLSVGKNSLTAWATVLNAKVPGITTTVDGQALVLTSNKGRSDSASVEIFACDFITSGIFDAPVKSVGSSRDYSLDRNTSQIRLDKVLAAGDRLSVGTKHTRAFVESSVLGAVSLTSPIYWFSVDAGAEAIPASIAAGTELEVSISGTYTWGHRLQIRYPGTGAPFGSVDSGDQVMLWDSAFAPSLRGAWRVSSVSTNNKRIYIDRAAMMLARAGHKATLLNDGRILITGGCVGLNIISNPSTPATNSCVIFDPSDNSYTYAAPMSEARVFHTATLFADGPDWKVLVAGGQLASSAYTATDSAEVYDPNTDTWTPVDALPSKMSLHSAAIMPSGKVLVVGGYDETGTDSSSCYLYDSGSWTAASPLSTARSEAMIGTYTDGAVVAGGVSGVTILDSIEFYDEVGDSWTLSASTLTTARRFGAAVNKSTDEIAFVGGFTTNAFSVAASSSDADVYDAATDSISAIGPMTVTAGSPVVGWSSGSSRLVVAFGVRDDYNAQAYYHDGVSWNVSAQPLGGDMPRVFADSVMIGSKLYVFGGLDSGTDTAIASAEVYDESTDTWGELDDAVDASLTLTTGGMSFVRANLPVQRVEMFTATGYTASTLATEISSDLKGAKAATYRTSKLRVRTNTYGSNGDIALAGANNTALGISVSDAVTNTISHIASVESSTAEGAVPNFRSLDVFGSRSEFEPVFADGTAGTERRLLGSKFFAKQAITTVYGEGAHYGNNNLFNTAIESIENSSGSYVAISREAPEAGWAAGERGYWAVPYWMAPSDTLNVLIDNDTETKRYSANMFRRLQAQGTYGTTLEFVDSDNDDENLGEAFGFGANGFNFDDFAIYMRARGKTHDGDATKRALWRYYRFGADGNKARVAYALPDAPDSSVAVSVDNTSSIYTDIDIKLPGGSQRNTANVNSTTKIGNVILQKDGNDTAEILFVFGLTVTSATADGLDNTTLTLGMPDPAVTDHGLQIGDKFYLNATSGPWVSGVYTITNVTATTITYNDGGLPASGPTANIGTISLDYDNVTLAGSGTVAGDFFRFEANTGILSNFKEKTMRIDTYDPLKITAFLPDVLFLTAGTTLSWDKVTESNGFRVFANPQKTATEIVTAVNLLYSATGSVCPIEGASDGVGVIDRATWEEKDDGINMNGSGVRYPLLDGVAFVKSTTIPVDDNAGNYQFELKNSVSASLLTNNYWVGEQARLVPVTAANIASWLNAPSVAGISSVADVELSSAASKVQISSKTIGSSGSVEVQGGTANSMSSSAINSSVIDDSTTCMICNVPTANAAGFMADSWVAVDNTVKLPRTGAISNTTHLVSMTYSGGVGSFVMSTQALWSSPNLPSTNVTLKIEKQGQFTALTEINNALLTTSVQEGDWIYLKSPTTTSNDYDIAQTNMGLFRVVRKYQQPDYRWVVWIENPNVEEQTMAHCDVVFVDDGSMLPGDEFVVNTDDWGASVRGKWKVLTVGYSGGVNFASGLYYTFTAKPVGFEPSTNVAYVAPGVLISNPNLVQVIEGTASRFIKRIASIAPNQTDTTATDLKFDTLWGQGSISEAAGSVITALGKLNFPLGVYEGRDGYRYHTGLIGEVNKVIYGDQTDPSTYPGVAAAGAQINISGPIVKRIKIALSVRVRTGASTTEIANYIKTAVASLINTNPVGAPIPLSSVVTTAASVGGVVAVTVLAPTYAVGSDLIPVQPSEKAMVVDAENDISVSFVGE